MTQKLTLYDKIIFFLSLYVVFELYLSSTMTYSPELLFWINVVDTVICFIFIFDFFFGLYIAEDKLKFVKQNWINLVSSIPFVGFLRIGRIARILRVLRILRSGKIIYSMINKTKPFSAFTNLLVLTIVFIFLLSISFYHAEKDVNTEITSIKDSIAWCFITTITFSYHKKIMPLSGEGTFIYIILVLIRLILFGTLIGVITDYFVDKDELKAKKTNTDTDKSTENNTLSTELNEKISALENKLNKIEVLLEEIKNQKPNKVD